MMANFCKNIISKTIRKFRPSEVILNNPYVMYKIDNAILNFLTKKDIKFGFTLCNILF